MRMRGELRPREKIMCVSEVFVRGALSRRLALRVASRTRQDKNKKKEQRRACAAVGLRFWALRLLWLCVDKI